MIGRLCALSLLVLASLVAQTVPRPAPELVINFPGGKQTLLSSYKGKVVLCEILFTTCPHCQHESQLVSKLHQEYGTRGFQPLGLAINPMAGMLVGDFIRDYHVSFPVGFSERDPALAFLGIDPYVRWAVPQVVIIDKKGVIRAQTPPLSDEKFQDENWLRQQIEPLLKEGSETHRAGTPHKRST
jgi:peroxiredoxin